MLNYLIKRYFTAICTSGKGVIFNLQKKVLLRLKKLRPDILNQIYEISKLK